jgi:hypothetical protein
LEPTFRFTGLCIYGIQVRKVGIEYTLVDGFERILLTEYPFNAVSFPLCDITA